MVTNITYGIDVDEVLRSLLPNMIKLYNEFFDPDFTIDDVKDFRVDVSFPKIKEVTGESASKWFFEKFGHTLFRESEPIGNVKKNIERLRTIGKVIIITYQKSYDNKIDTLQWFERLGIDVDGFCFVKDKTVVHTDYIIDDNDYNFIGSNCKYGILINAPYNKDIKLNDLLKKSNLQTIRRFNSFEEFVDDEIDNFFTK